MSWNTIRYGVEAGIARLTLNRPELLNGMNAEMRGEIRQAVIAAGNEARVLVITGAGRGFCSGQDLGGETDVTRFDLREILTREYEPMLRAIHDCPIPTIAAVNGPAAGAGANVALACDVVIAAESAFFMQAFSLIGLIPDAGGTYVLPRNIGFARAMGAALFADRIPARQAAEWGLIWETVPDEEFSEHVDRKARLLADGPTGAYRLIKQAIRASFDNDLDAQLALEAELQGLAGRSRDFAEGVQAFNEKRKPRFEGR